ncbi:MAG TPA: EamA family transporter [Micrococcales bacterium]|uniref:DMT family transporter n=1 Tax=Miniimonas arenae TaxID=676201 RepID=UPI000EE90EA0|nr:EamA family transporter [Miniimonas arenae]HCX84270.1 EamA family transporter [Micrococcales bacterium]
MPPQLLVLLAAVCFGTTGTAQAFAPDGATSVSLGSARLVVGGLGLALVAWIARARVGGAALHRPILDPSATNPLAPNRPATGRPVSNRPAPGVLARVPTWLVVLVAAAGVLAYQPTFFGGTRANGVAVGTVLALGSAPLFTGLLEWTLLGRRPGRVWLGATALAVVGIGLLASGEGDAGGGPGGLLLSLGAGASYALYAVGVKVLLDRGWASADAVGAVFGVGGVLALPLLLATDTAWLATPSGLALVAWLGVVTVIVAYLLFGAGLRHLPAATVSTLTLAEPATAALLGLLVLDERLAPLAWAGVAVVALAVVLLSVTPTPGMRLARTRR